MLSSSATLTKKLSRKTPGIRHDAWWKESSRGENCWSQRKKREQHTLLVEGPRAPMGITPEKGEEKEPSRSMGPIIAKTQHNNTHINNNFFFDNLKILYTNADTLTSSKRNELAARVKLEHPDIIIITEIYPKNSIHDITEEILKIDGYDIMKSNGNRGVAIYTATHLMASIIETNTNFQESLWCNIKITSNHNMIVGGIYRSPSSVNNNNDLLPEILIEIQMIKHDHIIIAGDFNFKQINWETREVSGNPGCYAYQIFDSINDLFLEEMVKQPTRFRGTDNPSALDWILTGNSGMIDEITAEPPLGPSDHCLLSTNYNCMIEKKTQRRYQ